MGKDSKSLELYNNISTAISKFESRNNYTRLGTLVIGELVDCKTLPATTDGLGEIMLASAKLMNVTVVESTFHAFSPFGLSGVLVLAESHFSIHTWPEYNTAAIDLFCCGKANYKKGIGYLEESFGAQFSQIVEIPRIF